jgi:autotransporter family porin
MSQVLYSIFLLVVAAVLIGVACPNKGFAEPHYFATLRPGAALPSDCAGRVRRSSWEPRPLNYEANHTRGKKGVVANGANAKFNRKFGGRVDGNFIGTTDEIIQWAACKWGFDEDITRARAVQESYWQQSTVGDQSRRARTCTLIGKSAPCWQSYGILQVKGTVHVGTYPLAEQSTAFNLDYALAWLRACYEGAFGHWLANGYAKGDEWGCVGAWYSGEWYDEAATDYIREVKAYLVARVWKEPDFSE